MESSTGKESIVSRLFGFGRRKQADPPEKEKEQGFARTGATEAVEIEGDEPAIRVPEQVIRIRTGSVAHRDELVTAIGDSFRELTSMLSSVSERLDRQDTHTANLVDQIQELPEYLRALPKLHEDHNEALHGMASTLARIPEAQEEQARAVHSLTERVAEGTDAVHGVKEVLGRIPEELRARSEAQETAIKQVAAAQNQMAKVVHHGHQKSLQVFHQATQKTLQNVQKSTQKQFRQMEHVLDASVTNMKRMFILAFAFMLAALVAVVGLLYFR